MQETINRETSQIPRPIFLSDLPVFKKKRLSIKSPSPSITDKHLVSEVLPVIYSSVIELTLQEFNFRFTFGIMSKHLDIIEMSKSHLYPFMNPIDIQVGNCLISVEP